MNSMLQQLSLGDIVAGVAAFCGAFATFVRHGDRIRKIEEWTIAHQRAADARDELGRKLEIATVKLVDAVDYLTKRIDQVDAVVIRGLQRQDDGSLKITESRR